MRQRPFRFLHASDLYLGRPVTGLGDLPAHLLSRVVDAPRLAAERLFRTAISEQVDFVVLSGNIVNPYHTGPWGPVFLVEQFEKLKAANIRVYWAAGKLDSAERWPAELPLPSNVTLFPTSHVDDPIFERDGFSIARLQGVSCSPERRKIRPGEFNPDNTGLFTIAVAVGKVNPSTLKKRGIDYWALGGMPARHTSYGNPPAPRTIERNEVRPTNEAETNTKANTRPNAEPPKANGGTAPKQKSDAPKPVREDFLRSSIVHYPGTMLARSFDELGNYGATLVDVDETGKVHISFVPTSPLRFVDEQVRFESGTDFERVKDELRDRLITHQSLQDGYDLYIRWAIDASEDFELKLRRDGVAEKICDELRQEFGMNEPFAWVVEIKAAIPENFPPEFYDQETIMGDYLRRLRHYQLGETELPSLSRYLPQDSPIFPQENQPSQNIIENNSTNNLDDYAEPLLTKNSIKRDDLLRWAAMLGVEMLGENE